MFTGITHVYFNQAILYDSFLQPWNWVNVFMKWAEAGSVTWCPYTSLEAGNITKWTRSANAGPKWHWFCEIATVAVDFSQSGQAKISMILSYW